MFKRSAPRSRLALASAAVIGLLMLSTGSVAAATGPGTDMSFSSDGKSADASSGGCTSNGDGTSTCADVGISIFVGTRTDDVSGTTHPRQLCVNLTTYTYVEDTGEYVGEALSESGCRDRLANNAIRFGRKLASVTLAMTTVPVGQTVCDKSVTFTCVPGPTHDVTVSGTWTGVGPTTFSSYRSVFDDGTCRVTESGRGNSRGATFAGTIDGRSISNDWSSIADGKSAFRSKCTKP